MGSLQGKLVSIDVYNEALRLFTERIPDKKGYCALEYYPYQGVLKMVLDDKVKTVFDFNSNSQNAITRNLDDV